MLGVGICPISRSNFRNQTTVQLLQPQSNTASAKQVCTVLAMFLAWPNEAALYLRKVPNVQSKHVKDTRIGYHLGETFEVNEKTLKKLSIKHLVPYSIRQGSFVSSVEDGVSSWICDTCKSYINICLG